MAQGDTQITLVGNIASDVELRFTPAGAAVCNFRVASTPRTFNKTTNQWEDGEAMFITCNVWRQAAENVAQSLAKGMRVIVQGRLKARTFQNREGENRTVFEIDVDEVGPSLAFATAQVDRSTRDGGNQQGAATFNPVQAQNTGNGWNAPAPQGGFSNNNEESPF